MNFEEFEKKILEKGYWIVAMNQYSVNGKCYTYCVVFNKSEEKAFKSEAQDSKEVFEDIHNQIIDSEKKK